MKRRRSAAGLVAGACGSIILGAFLQAPVQAKIDLVTLPGRDATELTIYNSQDLTLVRETRTLSFTKGENEIQFSWANTLIDPTSLQIELGTAPGLTVTDAVYPANTREMIVWNIEAAEDTSAAVEISYFTSGLTWAADYVILADGAQETFSLQQFTTVRNNSGEDFDDAKTRVVVGEVNLVEMIAELARRGIMVDDQKMARALAEGREKNEQEVFFAMAPAAAGSPFAADAFGAMEAKAIVKKAVSEYYLFAVEGTEDILSGWGKELPEKPTESIPFDLSYEIDPQKYGNSVVKFYKLKNTDEHKLGKTPLPEGQYYVYSDDGRGGLRFEGSATHEYIPVGEDVELNLGSDGMVLYEVRPMETRRENFEFNSTNDIIGWEEVHVVDLELKNSRDRAVPMKLTHYLEGDWTIEKASRPDYKKLSSDSVRWEFDLAPSTTETITLSIRYRMGSLARTTTPPVPQADPFTRR